MEKWGRRENVEETGIERNGEGEGREEEKRSRRKINKYEKVEPVENGEMVEREEAGENGIVINGGDREEEKR